MCSVSNELKEMFLSLGTRNVANVFDNAINVKFKIRVEIALLDMKLDIKKFS